MGARISPLQEEEEILGIVFPHWSALACVSSKRRSITGLQTCLQGTARHGKRAAYQNGLTRHGGDMWGVGAMRPLVRILWLLVTTTICIVVIVIHNTSSFDDLVSELLHKNQVIRKKTMVYVSNVSAFSTNRFVLCGKQVSHTNQHTEYLASGLDDRARYVVTAHDC